MIARIGTEVHAGVVAFFAAVILAFYALMPCVAVAIAARAIWNLSHRGA